jgi:hypothetical protein
MTDREAFEEWAELQGFGHLVSKQMAFDAWQAATLAERERCAKVREEQLSDSDYEYLAHNGHWDIRGAK